MISILKLKYFMLVCPNGGETNNMDKSFGPYLKGIRRSKKLTQNDIAKSLSITRQAYSNYEQGRCLPSPDTLAGLSVILETNLFTPFLKSAFNLYNPNKPFK